MQKALRIFLYTQYTSIAGGLICLAWGYSAALAYFYGAISVCLANTVASVQVQQLQHSASPKNLLYSSYCAEAVKMIIFALSAAFSLYLINSKGIYFISGVACCIITSWTGAWLARKHVK